MCVLFVCTKFENLFWNYWLWTAPLKCQNVFNDRTHSRSICNTISKMQSVLKLAKKLFIRSERKRSLELAQLLPVSHFSQHISLTIISISWARAQRYFTTDSLIETQNNMFVVRQCQSSVDRDHYHADTLEQLQNQLSRPQSIIN